MRCEICDELNDRYTAAVAGLRIANQHLRQAKVSTLQAALSRREVHDGLSNLIAAEAELKAHKAWHIQCLTAIPPAEAAASV